VIDEKLIPNPMLWQNILQRKFCGVWATRVHAFPHTSLNKLRPIIQIVKIDRQTSEFQAVRHIDLVQGASSPWNVEIGMPRFEAAFQNPS
jgi:hypothetical protein